MPTNNDSGTSNAYEVNNFTINDSNNNNHNGTDTSICTTYDYCTALNTKNDTKTKSKTKLNNNLDNTCIDNSNKPNIMEDNMSNADNNLHIVNCKYTLQ